MKTILVVSVNWLGDVVFSTPVYKALKDNYPGSRITVLAVPRVEDVLSLCPYIDEVIVYDEDGSDRPLVEKVRLASQLRRGRFDGVFFLRPSVSRGWITALAGIPVRVGFKTKNALGCINRQVSNTGLEDLHRVDVYLSVIERFGLVVRDRYCRLVVSEDSLALADRLLNARGIKERESFCVVNTGGNWDLKQWPWERFAELTRRLVQKKGIKVVLSGSGQDVDRVARIAALSGVEPVELAGVTSLASAAAVFTRSQYIISADSGPLHLASALGIRTIAIFGPTRPEITGPRGQGRADVLIKDVGCNRKPCYYLECPENRCMRSVEVEDVIKIL